MEESKMDFFEEMEARIPKGEARTRFAPSPTGYMHVGNLRTALYTWLIARHFGGKFILRIEDTDQGRLVDGAVDVIYKTMAECGLTHDEGPDVGGPVGPYVQSERRDLFGKYAKLLCKKGGAYYCFCQKSEEEPADESDSKEIKKHVCACRDLPLAEAEARVAAGEPFVIRQRIPQEGTTTFHDVSFGDITVENKELEDQVLLKSDGLPTYNFANVVDDHLMGITHVIRGTEYLSSTPKYNLIYDAFGWERPKYMHLPPIMKDQTRKLSKRFGDANFEDFIAKGYLPEAVVNYIALLGWCPKDNKEKMTMQEMIEAFDVDGISHSSSIFDEAKMRWLNGEYLKAMSAEDFEKVATPWIEKAIDGKDYDVKELASLMQTRVDILSEIPEKLAFLNEFGEYDLDMYVHQKMKVDKAVALKAVEVSIDALKDFDDWSADAIKEQIKACSEQAGMKSGQVMFSMRVALTGAPVTPGGAIEMAMVLKKDETLRRLNYSLELLKNAQ